MVEGYPNRAGEKDSSVDTTPGSVPTAAIAAAASAAVWEAEIGPDVLGLGLDGSVTMHPPRATAQETTTAADRRNERHRVIR